MAQKTENAHINVTMNAIQAAQSVKELDGLVRKYRSQWRNATIGTKEHIDATKALKAAQARVAEYRNEIRATEGAWARMSETFDKYKGIATGIMAASGGVILGIKSLTDESREFEKTLTNVFTLLSQDDFEKFHDELERGSKEIMVQYGLSFEDVNKAMFDAISAGVPAGEAIGFLHKNAKLAIGGVTDLGTAVDGTTTILNAFGRDVSELDEITNAFFTSQKYGKTTVEDLAKEIGKVAPVANLAGLTYQETLSAIAAITLGGIKTAEASTYLKGALQAVIKPTKEAEEVLRAYGIPVGIAEVRSAGLGNVLTKLNEVILQNPDAIAKAIPAVEGLTGVAALSGKGLEKYSEILNQVNNDVGNNSSLTQAFNKQMETSAQYVARAEQELALASITLGEKLEPVMGLLIFSLSNLLRFLSDLPHFMRENEMAIIALAAAYLIYNQASIMAAAIKLKEAFLLKAGIGLKIKDAIVTRALAVQTTYLAAAQTAGAGAGSKFIGVLKGVRAVMLTALGPVGLIIAGIAGLVLAIKGYDKYNAESVRLEKEKQLAQEQVAASTKILDDSYQILHGSMREFNRLSVEEKKNLRESIQLKLKEAQVQMLLAQQKQKDIQIENTRASTWDKTKNFFSNLVHGNAAGVAVDNLNSALENGKEAAGEMNDEIEQLGSVIEGFQKDMETINTDLNAEAIGDAIPTDSITAMNEKIGEYQKALNNAKIGSEDYIRIQKKLADVQAKLKSGSIGIPDKKEQEKLKHEYENFQKELQKIGEETAIAKLPEHEREIEQATKHYNDLLAKAVAYYRSGTMKAAEFETAKEELAAARQVKIDEINRKEYEEEAKLREKQLQENREKQNEAYEQMSELREEIFQLTLTEEEREIRAVEEAYAKKIALAEELNLSTIELEEEKRRQIKEIQDAYDEKENEKLLAKQQFAIDSAKVALDTVDQILSERRNRNTESVLNDLETQKDAELKGAEGNAEKKEAIEKKYQEKINQVKREDFEKDKRAAMATALIKGGLGALNAFVIAKDPVSLAIMLGTVAVSTAANMALIASQQAPGYEVGGYTGPGLSHDVAGVVHKNEYVVPTFVLRKPEGFNMVAALEAMRQGKSGFAEGGPTSPLAIPAPQTDPSTPEQVPNNDALVSVLSQLSSVLKSGVKAYLVFGNVEADQVKNLIDENESVKSDATL
jgi:TP901 family phage tail tape measure protein